MKQFLCAALILSTISNYAVTPYYSIRSQSENAARELVGAGWNTQINLCDYECWNGIFAFTAEYSKSFQPHKIGECLFGNQCCFPYSPDCPNGCNPCLNNSLTAIRISGSQVASRGPCDWLAENFGLPTNFVSAVTFEPEIENFIIDGNFNIGFDAWCKGLYFNIHAPIVHTRWDLNFCECCAKTLQGCACVEVPCSSDYWPGYFSSTVTSTNVGIECKNLVRCFESYVNGCAVINDPNIVFNPLCYTRMSRTRLTKTGLADLRMALGYNFFCNNNYNLGLSLRAAAPTGNRPEACYLFEPIIGNGKHWEVGAGLNSHWIFWHGCYDEESIGIYVDANITHMFTTKQCRTFDLKCKPFSRYMLAGKYGEPVEDLLAAPNNEGTPVDPKKPSKQFLGIYSPVANLTTLAVDVSIGVQADVAVMLQYICGNFSFDIGYNLWVRSCEKIKPNCCWPSPFQDNTWGLKGDAFMYGYKQTMDGSISTTAVPLSATQSRATICSGTNNWPNGINSTKWSQNPGIDNPQPAWDDDQNALLIFDVATSTTRHIYTSKDPEFIAFSDIDLCSARTKGLSHKIFIHFDHTWENCEDWTPYLGIGGEIEFGYHNDACCTPCCNSCQPCEQNNTECASSDGSCLPCTTNNDRSSCCSCALSQWGIWLKGGVGFN